MEIVQTFEDGSRLYRWVSGYVYYLRVPEEVEPVTDPYYWFSSKKKANQDYLNRGEN